MSTVQIRRGELVTLPAGTARTVNLPYLVGGGKMLVIAAETVDTTKPVSAYRTGVFTVPKKSGDTPTQFGLAYWDDTNKYITTSSASGANSCVGWWDTAPASGDTTAPVILNGGLTA
jgi:predicted RecA/RadA family phage recombinase